MTNRNTSSTARLSIKKAPDGKDVASWTVVDCKVTLKPSACESNAEAPSALTGEAEALSKQPIEAKMAAPRAAAAAATACLRLVRRPHRSANLLPRHITRDEPGTASRQTALAQLKSRQTTRARRLGCGSRSSYGGSEQRFQFQRRGSFWRCAAGCI